MSRRDEAIIRLIWDTGGRLSEIASLDLTDVDLQRRVVEVIGKGGKRRGLPFSPMTGDATGCWCWQCLDWPVVAVSVTLGASGPGFGVSRRAGSWLASRRPAAMGAGWRMRHQTSGHGAGAGAGDPSPATRQRTSDARLADIVGKILPTRRHRTCPRAVKHLLHNAYRAKKRTKPASTRHPGPATIRLRSLTRTARSSRATRALRTNPPPPNRRAIQVLTLISRRTNEMQSARQPPNCHQERYLNPSPPAPGSRRPHAERLEQPTNAPPLYCKPIPHAEPDRVQTRRSRQCNRPGSFWSPDPDLSGRRHWQGFA